jgi:hypothetical protein
MAASSNLKEADIFRKAVVILDAHERANYLRQACYGDEELKRRIELLVAADADETGFLKLDDTDMGEINGSTEGRLPINSRPSRYCGPTIYKRRWQFGFRESVNFSGR